MILSKHINATEIVESLAPTNGEFFKVNDLLVYANKVITLGDCLAWSKPDTSELLSYVVFYNNKPEIYISMVWTDPKHSRQGLAKNLLLTIMESNDKVIVLELHPENPARFLYEKLHFEFECCKGEKLFLRYFKEKQQPITFDS